MCTCVGSCRFVRARVRVCMRLEIKKINICDTYSPHIEKVGATPLYVAAQNGNLISAELLLQHKASPDLIREVIKQPRNHYQLVSLQHPRIHAFMRDYFVVVVVVGGGGGGACFHLS